MKLKRVSQYLDIPTKIIKENSDAYITPSLKECNKNLKKNYRPVSVFPNLSKVLERRMFNSMSKTFADIFSKYHFDFRKGFSTKQCLLVML